MNKARKVSYLAMLVSLTVVLSILEGLIPAFLPPGVKLGLSNIAVMYAIFVMDKKTAFLLCVSKSFFVFITRGALAGELSFCGGVLSISVIIILLFLFKDKLSYVIISILGAVSHNLGQLAAISVILKSNYIFYYIPILLVSGIVMGSITGIVLGVVMPRLDINILPNRTKEL